MQDQGDQALLRSVVQITLDPPARPVGGGHDPRPRGVERGLGLGVDEGGDDQLGEGRQPPRVSAESGSSRVDATLMTPHSRPSTLIGTPTAERNPEPRSASAASPEAPA